MDKEIKVDDTLLDYMKHGDFHYASYQYELLVKNIKTFQEKIKLDEEVVLLLASFGQTIRLYVTNIGYANPSLIYFHGFIEGEGAESQLIQHVSQLNFLITTAKRLNENEPARRIGFKI